MKKYEYLLYSLTTDNFFKLEWYMTFLTILTKDFTTNQFLRIVAEKYEVKVNDEWVELEDAPVYEAIYGIKDTTTLPANTLRNQPNKVDTTIGKIIVNKVLLDYNFGSKIEYINTKTSVSDIEKILVIKLKNEEILVPEYLSFTDSVTFLRGLSMITNISATPKNILPPPGLNKAKEELAKEFSKKYGERWTEDRPRVVEYIEELKKIDTDWLKDDPTMGKLINKKIKDNARVRMFIAFGSEAGFGNANDATFISNSLMDGYPENKKELVAMMNGSRQGSYSRGAETMKGGVAAKVLLRSTSNYSITTNDCGTNVGKEMLVTKENKSSLINRNILVNGKTIKITDPDKYVGQVVMLRSPMYCKQPGSVFCSECVGGNMKDYQKGIPLVVTQISSILLNTSMKAFHNTQVSLLNLNIKDIIS